MSLLNDLKKVFFGAKSVAKHQASKAGEAAKQAGSDLAEASDDLLDTTKAAAKDLMDKAPEYLEKGKDALEDLTDKIWKEADAAVDKGRELNSALKPRSRIHSIPTSTWVTSSPIPRKKRPRQPR